jgi:hypothetical protein
VDAVDAVFHSAALHYGIHRPAAIAEVTSDTALAAAITEILFEPGANGLEELGRITARHIGATERLERAVHGAILMSVFALAPLLFTVVGPPLRRVQFAQEVAFAFPGDDRAQADVATGSFQTRRRRAGMTELCGAGLRSPDGRASDIPAFSACPWQRSQLSRWRA